MAKSKPAGPPPGNGRPTPREAVARAQAAAGPAMARAQAAAAPKVEAAAVKAGSLLSTLRDRAKETAKSFSDGYGTNENTATPDAAPAEPERPRPRPRPARTDRTPPTGAGRADPAELTRPTRR